MKTPLSFEDELSLMYPPFAGKLLTFYNKMKASGHEVRLTSGLRSLSEQKRIFLEGRHTGGPIKTHNLVSMHNYGLAGDFCFRGKDPYPKDESLWALFHKTAESCGLEWGGRWKMLVDKPHLECTFGLDRNRIDAIFHTGGLRGLWEYLDTILGRVRGSGWLISVEKSEARLNS